MRVIIPLLLLHTAGASYCVTKTVCFPDLRCQNRNYECTDEHRPYCHTQIAVAVSREPNRSCEYALTYRANPQGRIIIHVPAGANGVGPFEGVEADDACTGDACTGDGDTACAVWFQQFDFPLRVCCDTTDVYGPYCVDSSTKHDITTFDERICRYRLTRMQLNGIVSACVIFGLFVLIASVAAIHKIRKYRLRRRPRVIV